VRGTLIVATVAAAIATATCAAIAVAAAPSASKATAHSCWTQESLQPGRTLEPVSAGVDPDALARRVLARLGDSRLVKRIELAPPPPYTFQHGWWRHNLPPKDALWAYISAPDARAPRGPDARSNVSWMLGNWEVELVRRALRDEFCGAGGPPLVGTTVNGLLDKVTARGPFVQRFDNPPPERLREHIAKAAERYGFRVVSLRFLRPLQVAPVVVVETDRDCDSFVQDVPKIMNSLHAGSYEGFFFEAGDKDGSLAIVTRINRGKAEASHGVRSGCLSPYQTLGVGEAGSG
jgi:hypothetical protein